MKATVEAVGSHALYADTTGPATGPPVVFLHPSGSNATAWRAHVKFLGDDYACVVVDLPGHRHSRHVDWVSLEATAGVVAELIAALPGGRAHVVGLSLGGSVVLTLMARHPEVVDHAVVDGAGALPNRWAWALKAAVSAVSPFLHTRAAIRFMGAALGVGSEDLPSFADGLRAIPPTVFRRAFCQAQDVRITDALLEFPRPALFVAGERDPQATRASNATLAAALPAAAARFLPGVGHAWMAARPDLHVAMVRGWLDDQHLPDALQPETQPDARPAVTHSGVDGEADRTGGSLRAGGEHCEHRTGTGR